MGRILVVTHSANERDAVLWRTVLREYPHVDIVIPHFKNEPTDQTWIRAWQAEGRAFSLPASEPVGKGHSSLWVTGLSKLLRQNNYALLHAAMEPWALIPQTFVKRIPTVVQGAESIVVAAPWHLRLRRMGLRRVLANVAGFSAWGQSSMDAFLEAGLPNSTPRAVIPMGIPDPMVFARTPVPDLKTTFNILYVGRLEPEKGVQTVIEMLRMMPAEIPIHFRVLGTGTMANHLRTLAHDLPMTQIDFEGSASISDVRSAMQWCHLGVVPSLTTNRWMEQWGRVAVETIMSGRPCLVSDSGELPNISPIPGTVFSAGDCTDLRDKILPLVANPTSMQIVANRQFVSTQRFDASALATQVHHLWASALEAC